MERNEPKKKSAKVAITVFFLAAVCLFAYALSQRGLQPSERLQTPGRPAPDFIFQDRNDRMFSSSELKGCVWVADFIFTHCAGTCPLLAQEMVKLLREWEGDPSFKLVSFTVDPERDTVEVLRRYAEDFQAEGSKWRFLTGKKEDLYRVIRDGFLESAEESKTPRQGYEFIHSPKIVLVDRGGFIRGTYDIEKEGDTKLLARDARYLLSKEAPPAGDTFTIHLGAPRPIFPTPKP
jgi:protein SCO1/2